MERPSIPPARCARLRAAAAAASAVFILAGCAAGGAGMSGGSAGSRDPLLDAPYHSEATCTTERPITVLSRMNETPFVCSDLGVTATVDELRDAGWRIISIDIGPDSESEKHVGFPVTLVIRKLF